MILKKQVIKISLLPIFIVFLLMPKNAFSSTVEILEDALTKVDATLNSIPGNIKRVAVYGI